MGRPVIQRAIKRTRQYLAGNENYAGAGLESLASDAAIALVQEGAAKLVARIKNRAAKRKAKTPAPKD